jgi:hypothetical protein
MLTPAAAQGSGQRCKPQERLTTLTARLGSEVTASSAPRLQLAPSNKLPPVTQELLEQPHVW